MERYLSSQDAATILGVTDTAVRLMIQRGELPVAGEMASGIRLLRLEAVQKLAAERIAQGKRRRRVEMFVPETEAVPS